MQVETKGNTHKKQAWTLTLGHNLTNNNFEMKIINIGQDIANLFLSFEVGIQTKTNCTTTMKKTVSLDHTFAKYTIEKKNSAI